MLSPLVGLRDPGQGRMTSSFALGPVLVATACVEGMAKEIRAANQRMSVSGSKTQKNQDKTAEDNT
jgi:hypothetical protein